MLTVLPILQPVFIKMQPVTGEELKQEQEQICSWVGRMGAEFLSESFLNYHIFFFAKI